MAKYSGKDGSSLDKAIRIEGARNESEGLAAEYAWLAQEFGVQEKDWTLVMQSLMHDKGRSYDQMIVKIADGTEKEIYFDITDFFGKF